MAKYFLIALFGLLACKNLPPSLSPLPPYQAYIRSLEQADLLESRLGQLWITAGEQVLITDSVPFELPFSFSGLFEASTPEAHGFRFDILAGQKLSVTGMVMADGKVFADLFVRQENGWEPIHSSDSVIYINQEFDQFTECLLRIQPELLVTTRYSFTINSQPVLLNPVSGAENRDIGSVYGDPRDGGNRSHEGIDIFAPRGTPVVAPAAGRIVRANQTDRGGKVVWMRDQDRSQAYYFAHLDSQLVRPGERVVPGDTIGLVGNTGNARTTPPHLHFGIYQRGSKDPMSYIRTRNMIEESVGIDTTINQTRLRVAVERLNLRSGPGTENSVTMQLDLHEFVKVLGHSGDWVKVNLANNRSGFLFTGLLEPLTSYGNKAVSRGSPVLSYPDSVSVPLAVTNEDTTVETLANGGPYQLVRTSEGIEGWITFLKCIFKDSAVLDAHLHQTLRSSFW